MNPISLWIRSLAIACAVLTGAACHASREVVDDGFRELCVNSAASLCRVPYSQVIGARSNLVGKVVSTKGFLAKDGGAFTLYGSREQAAYGIREGAIHVIGAAEFTNEFNALEGRFVMITGMLAPSDEWWATLNVTLVPFELAERGGDFPPAPPHPADLPR